MKKQFEAFESSNARLWDVESDTEDERPAQQTAQEITSPAAPSNSHGFKRPNSTRNTFEQPHTALRISQNKGSSTVTNLLTTSTQASHPRKGRRSNTTRPLRKPKEAFAEGLELITNRKQKRIEVEARKKQLDNKLLEIPDASEEIVVTGYYLWPKKSQSPMELFGYQLEDINPVRLSKGVWITWNDVDGCLVIDSGPSNHAQKNVKEAIEAIREAYKSAMARHISAEPLYLVVPPSVDVMKSAVRPRKYRPGLTMIELFGEGLSNKSRAAWKTEKEEMEKENRENLRKHLGQNLYNLQALKEEIRMRVTFGHFELPAYPPDFEKGQGTLQSFRDILKLPKAQAQAIFDKNLIDPMAAIFLNRKIINLDTEFVPVDIRTRTIQDVYIQNTLCLFFNDTRGTPVRIEADIEKTPVGHFRIGSTKYFFDNQRNKHVQVTGIDIERKVDWTLEATTDNYYPNPPTIWRTLVEAFITVETAEREDILGYKYPVPILQGVRDTKIDTTVLKSTFAYQMASSGYNVEISLYRQWNGQDTQLAPAIQTSVSMFHKGWSWLMDPTAFSPSARNWEERINEIFPTSTGKTEGVELLLQEVGVIQAFLSAGSSDFFANLRPQFQT